tara:strand:- start:3798 stop:4460 length:663 start_codon:yes stop_codon:yes gene_type:complete
VWNNALCSFFTVSADKRNVALLNDALTQSLSDRKTVHAEKALSNEMSAVEISSVNTKSGKKSPDKQKTAESTNTTEQPCSALSNISANSSSKLSERETHLLEMLQAVTVLPSPPLSTLSAEALTLTAFIEQYGPLASADIRIYEVDVANQLFAYELRLKDARAYVMYNFSFDTHPLPLPLGFMASTKVTLYRTDNPQPKRFVTSGPLSITYHSAVVVVVD